MAAPTRNDQLARGEHLAQEERYEEAAATFEALLNADPDDVDALNNLGVVAMQMEEYAKGLEAFLRALRLDVSNEALLDNLHHLVQHPTLHEVTEEHLQEVLGAGTLDEADRYYALAVGHLLDHEGTYRAAHATLDITPDLDGDQRAQLQGFAGTPRSTHHVLSSLQLQVVLVEDAEFNKLLFVSADIFGFDETTVEQIRQIARPWGIPPEAIILNATHTHYAPGTVRNLLPCLGPFYENYTEQIGSAIHHLLSTAFEQLQPCFLYAGHADAQIGSNRRRRVDGAVQFGVNEEGYYHRSTPFLVIDFLKDLSSLAVVNHGCHPTGLLDEAVISAGFPGYLRELLQESQIVDGAMFLQGAAGSAKPTVAHDGETRFTSEQEEVVEQSAQLAEAVITAINEPLRPVHGTIFARTTSVDLPFQPSLDADTRRQLAEQSSNLIVCEWAQRADDADALPLEVQLAGLDEHTCFVTFPGEPVGELARRLVESMNVPTPPFLLGYTNGVKAYLPTANMIAEGGYEADLAHKVYGLPAPFEPSVEAILSDAVASLVQHWQTPDQSNGYGRYQDLPQGRAFFCLSTGRCGTQTLTHVLDTATNARVYHHPRPYLIEETLAAYHDEIDKRSAFWRARGGVLRDAWKDDLVFGELDHNMTAFAPAIADEIDDARFLVLVRNPWDFVRSGMRRGYYRGHGWDTGRLRPEPDHPDADRWDAMSPFEKVCWLWNDTYARIRRFLDVLPEDRYRIVTFEDLIDGPDASEAIFDFLDLDGFDPNRIQQVLGQKLNQQTQGDFPKADAWSDEMHETLAAQCQEHIAFFGYDERGATYREAASKHQATASVRSAQQRLLFLEHEGISTGGHLDHVVAHCRDQYSTTYLKTTDVNEAARAIERADVVWLEWASPLTGAVTKQVRALRDKPVVCRLHGFEVFTDYPENIDWDVVDRLVFVAEHKRALFNQRVPEAQVEQTVIRNGVDVDQFSIPPGKTNTKNLLLLGHINYRKGLPMLLQFYHELRQRDPDYHLYIRGDWQDARYQLAVYTMVKELGLQEHITFVEEWIEDLDEWLADKSHVLSFSLEESFHYAVGNGMAAGMKPVIHAWHESRDIWPEEFIFRNLDEFLALMLDDRYEPERYRQWLVDHQRTKATQLDQIMQLLEAMRRPTAPTRARRHRLSFA